MHTGMPSLPPQRRRALVLAVLMLSGVRPGRAQPAHPQARWYEAALAMRQLAESWGDQAYGAVLVRGGEVIGQGPSRVVKHQNPDAHAEREALRDAAERFGAAALQGAVLYATSRPCALCERAAARAGVARMYFGAGLQDAGVPVLRQGPQ